MVTINIVYPSNNLNTQSSESIMPERECVTEDNNLYCWNDKTLEVDVYTRASVPVEKVPKQVLVKLMHLFSEKSKET
jgi:hypothetical protein